MAPRARRKYSIMDVTADIGIITSAPDLAMLYENAAYALFDLMCDMREVASAVETEIAVEGIDAPSTMVNWLNELLYIFEARSLLFGEFRVYSADPMQVRAVARGEEFDPSRHKVIRHIKAVTYHRLKVERAGDRWEAEVLFDI